MLESPQNPVAGTGTMSKGSEPDKKSSLRMDDQRLISTGCIADGNLCEIYLDKLHLMDQIVCVTQSAPPVETLMTIHGMHEAWLELVKRFEDGYIRDFFGSKGHVWNNIFRIFLHMNNTIYSICDICRVFPRALVKLCSLWPISRFVWRTSQTTSGRSRKLTSI